MCPLRAPGSAPQPVPGSVSDDQIPPSGQVVGHWAPLWLERQKAHPGGPHKLVPDGHVPLGAASEHMPAWRSGAGAYPLGRPLQMMLTTDPSHAHPGEAALQPSCSAAKQVPFAAHASATGKPQMFVPLQSASLLHDDPAPPSTTGAHVHVSQPLRSFRTPAGHAGAQPSPGHAGVHVRIVQSHVPSG